MPDYDDSFKVDQILDRQDKEEKEQDEAALEFAVLGIIQKFIIARYNLNQMSKISQDSYDLLVLLKPFLKEIK